MDSQGAAAFELMQGSKIQGFEGAREKVKRQIVDVRR
jgi:hypothetical protein